MSKDLPGKVAGKRKWPSHSENCFTVMGQQCEQCSWVLGPYPMRQWRYIYLRELARDEKLADPLPEGFMKRLCSTLKLEPEKYAEVFQTVINCKGAKQ